MPKRILHLLAICLFALTVMGADTSTTRVDQIGHKLVCQCGCGQILMECNHVGCPVSGPMIEALKADVASGHPEKEILATFINKYGPIVLAAPIRGGFDNVAWIVPIATLLLSIGGVIWLLRLWKKRNAARVAATPLPAAQAPGLHDRIRQETDYDNWGDGPGGTR